jgi:hypothetical protein
MIKDKSETFKIEIYDYTPLSDNNGWVQVGEITFSLNDLILNENNGMYTVNQPIIHKTKYSNGIPYKSKNIEMPKNLELCFYYKHDNYNSMIGLYEKDKRVIVSNQVQLVRTTGQLISTGMTKLSASIPKTITKQVTNQ